MGVYTAKKHSNTQLFQLWRSCAPQVSMKRASARNASDVALCIPRTFKKTRYSGGLFFDSFRLVSVGSSGQEGSLPTLCACRAASAQFWTDFEHNVSVDRKCSVVVCCMVLLHTTTYKPHTFSAYYRLKWLFILMYGIRLPEPPREALQASPSLPLNDASGAYKAALVVLRTD